MKPEYEIHPKESRNFTIKRIVIPNSKRGVIIRRVFENSNLRFNETVRVVEFGRLLRWTIGVANGISLEFKY